MKRIVLVAATTGYQTRAFDDAARRLSIQLILATDRCHILEDPWGDRAVAIRFEDPVESAARIPECDGILAVSDRPTLVAALAAERLGIPYHSFAAVSACTDKHVARERFRGAGLPAPDAFLASDEQAAAPFPCVLKPTGLSASRGVIRANNQGEFRRAFERIQKIARGPVQVEAFIEGREFALEGLMTHGHLTVLAIFDKPDPLDGPFFEESIYTTPSRESVRTQEEIIATTTAAARALGLSHGPIHAEMRVNEQGVFMLEIAARPIGGLCSKTLQFVSESPKYAEQWRAASLAGGLSTSISRPQKSSLASLRAGPSTASSLENLLSEGLKYAEQSSAGSLLLPVFPPATQKHARFSSPLVSDPLIRNSLEELLLRHAVGQDVSGYTRESSASGVMMIPIPKAGIYEGVTGAQAARAVPGIEDVIITARRGYKIVPLPEGASYLGFIFARADTAASVEHSLREAHKKLQFQILDILPIL